MCIINILIYNKQYIIGYVCVLQKLIWKKYNALFLNTNKLQCIYYIKFCFIFNPCSTGHEYPRRLIITSSDKNCIIRSLLLIRFWIRIKRTMQKIANFHQHTYIGGSRGAKGALGPPPTQIKKNIIEACVGTDTNARVLS